MKKLIDTLDSAIYRLKKLTEPQPERNLMMAEARKLALLERIAKNRVRDNQIAESIQKTYDRSSVYWGYRKYREDLRLQRSICRSMRALLVQEYARLSRTYPTHEQVSKLVETQQPAN